jgi:hypothetical protein
MIKTLHDKFKGLTIDIKVILKEDPDEVIVFIMPAFENKKSLEPMKFKALPDTIESHIKETLESIPDHEVTVVNDYNTFLKSVENAKIKSVSKKPSPKKPEVKKDESQPSMF